MRENLATTLKTTKSCWENFTNSKRPRPQTGRLIFKAASYGKIIDEYRGDNGFGYDPIFLSDELGKTFGEAVMEEKNTISHRSRALKDLLSKM